jgi:hypothetical protein
MPRPGWALTARRTLANGIRRIQSTRPIPSADGWSPSGRLRIVMLRRVTDIERPLARVQTATTPRLSRRRVRESRGLFPMGAAPARHALNCCS